MGEATRGELNLIDDLNEFVRQTSNQIEDVPETSGIRPHPQIEETETTLDTVRFGMNFGPLPEADVEPESTGGGAPPPCALDVTLVCDSVSASKSKCGFTEFPGHESDPPKYYLTSTTETSGTSDWHTGTGVQCWTGTYDYQQSETYDPSDCSLDSCSSASGTATMTYFLVCREPDPNCPEDCVCNATFDCSGWHSTIDSCCLIEMFCPEFQIFSDTGHDDCSTVTTSTTQSVHCNRPGPGGSFQGSDDWTVTQTLSDEYTTEMLIANTIAALPPYSDCFGCSAEMCSYPPGEDCSCTSSRDLSDDETSYAITRLKYKFTWTDPAPESCTLTWCIQTTDFDGNILSTEEMSTVVDAGATETDVFELLEPSENGYSNIIYPVTGACCVSGVCSEQTESDCAGMSGTWAGTCTDCTTNPC